MRSGQAHTELVTFESGLPDAAITWTLEDETGSTVASGTVTPPIGAVSANIQTLSAHNLLSTGVLYGYRDLTWNYTVNAVAVSGYARYPVEALIPFGVAVEGVRQKLGIDNKAELPDEQIPLVKAYLKFQASVGSANLLAAQSAGSYMLLLVADAIEATAALDLIPTMQVRVAKSETSGTNTFARQDIDWEAITEYLNAMISDAAAAVSPANVVTGGGLFSLSTPEVALFPG